MAPSINDLWGAPGSEADEDFDLDIDKLMGAVDQSIAESSRFRDDTEEAVEEVAVGDGDDEPDEPEEVQPVTGEVGDEEVPEESAAESAQPVATADPLGLLPPERRAALLAIDEVVQRDPGARDRVLQAIREQAAPVVEPPKLPDDIEEGSVAARLWHENQEIRAQVNQIGAGQRAQQEAFVKQAAVTAADAAGVAFAERYPQLEQSDIVDIARAAAGSGLAAKLASGSPDLKAAYMQALESTLWTNEAFRPKVLGAAPVVETPVAEKPETKARKRKLTALSSAASPVSAPAAPKSALETRVDGRLTPQSRLSLTREIASKLNRDQNEGTY